VQQDDRLVLLYVWNALIVFASMPFLTGAFFKSALAAAFVWVSCALGYGQRWLLRGGFALAALAFAIVLGVVPPLEKWGSSFRDAGDLLRYKFP
jgi:hypothetical protein